MSHGISTQKKNPESKTFQFGPWTITSWKSHILESEGSQRDKFHQELKLPQIPEMVFAENFLRLQHQSGCGIEFNALDALRLVDAYSDPIKVAASEEWQNARSDCEHIKNVVSPFDWTFTTDYRGTLFEEKPETLKVSPTNERIDIEKLKQKEPIHFYEDILLFEDELSDNGTSMLNVKVAGNNYVLREFTSREESTLNIPEAFHTDPNAVADYLKVTKEIFDKLQFISGSS